MVRVALSCPSRRNWEWSFLLSGTLDRALAFLDEVWTTRLARGAFYAASSGVALLHAKPV